MLANWVVVGLVGAALGVAACGGSTNASKGEPGAAGSVVVAGSSSAASGTAGLAGGGGTVGGGGGGDAALSGNAGQAGAPGGAGIVPAALEGCRGPSDAGCDVCYWAWDEDRSCTRESGGSASYIDYVALSEPCPGDGPRCAQCSYEAERSLRALDERRECGCPTGTPDGLSAVCPPESGSCGCYCNALGKLSRACPSLDNQR